METADNYSLSFFVEPHATLSGSVSLFYNRLADRITYVTGDDGVGQYQNFGLVTYTGGDLAVAWQPHDTFKIKGSYTYLEAVLQPVCRNR
jgi:vitamin B12 transporter